MSNGEIARQLADLKSQVSSGFTGTHARLDKVNGQLDTHREKLGHHATALAEHRVKISSLNHHLFQRRRGNGEGAEEGDEDESAPITRRDLAVFGGAVFVLVELVRWLPVLVSVGQGAP